MDHRHDPHGIDWSDIPNIALFEDSSNTPDFLEWLDRLHTGVGQRYTGIEGVTFEGIRQSDVPFNIIERDDNNLHDTEPQASQYTIPIYGNTERRSAAAPYFLLPEVDYRDDFNNVFLPSKLMQTQVDATKASPKYPPVSRRPLPSNICAVQVASDLGSFAFQCTNPDCYQKSYKRWYEFERHYNATHAAEKTVFWCPVPKCNRSDAEGHRPFPRKDKMTDHAWKIHDVQVGSSVFGRK